MLLRPKQSVGLESKGSQGNNDGVDTGVHSDMGRKANGKEGKLNQLPMCVT